MDTLTLVGLLALAVALVIGAVFLAGGIAASRMIPAPAWFVTLDLLGAYVPMAWLGARLGAVLRQPSES